MNLVMKKKRRGTGTTQLLFYYTYGYTTGYLGMWLSLRRGENAPALRKDGEDAEDRLHRKSEEMWWSHRKQRDVSTGVDHKMGKDVPALKIDGGDVRTMR